VSDLSTLSDSTAMILSAAQAAFRHQEGSTMSTQAPEGQAEVEVVTGQVTHIIVKGQDKWQIAVVPSGSQYAKNLWTKDAGLVAQMEANINSHYSFVCGPSYWTMADGKQVRSLWINSVTAPGMAGNGQQPATTTGQAVVAQAREAQGQPGIAPLEKEERIMREHAMGVVALMLPYLKPDERNARGMVAVAEGLIHYYRLGPDAFVGKPEPVEETPPEPTPPAEDDIPF
jgi:hypothetical protein